jgi:acyl-[acyl-carrier-protein] desaturase
MSETYSSAVELERHPGMEVIESLQGFVGENLFLLSPVDQAWQPTDYLPDLTTDDWAQNLLQYRDTAQRVSDDLLVILVGNLVTEEALPNYAVSLEQIAHDPTGTGTAPWARWLRGWTAEENRHGDLINAYLRLTGRVDMRAVERTIHHLIRNGFAPGWDHAYEGLVYAAFQERATRITHGNVGKLAAALGEDNLALICRKIAADETRHETFYTRVIGQVMDRDPHGGMLAYNAMLKGKIAMPGRLMFDGKDPDLFDHFGVVTQRNGAYTFQDYGGIITHLNGAWDIARRSVHGEAAKAQEYICRQPERYMRLAGEIADRLAQQPHACFSWIHGRQV